MLVTAESDKTEKFGFYGFCFVIPVPVLKRCAPLLLLLPMRDGRRKQSFSVCAKVFIDDGCVR